MKTLKVNTKDDTVITVDWTQEEIDEHEAEQQAELELSIREAKKVEIEAEMLLRIQAQLSQVETLADVFFLKSLVGAFELTPAGDLAKDIYVYGMTKIAQADTAPIGDVVAYDPVSDVNWPE